MDDGVVVGVHRVTRKTAVRIAAVMVPFATCALLATMRDALTGETAVLVLVLWVVGAAATGDRIAGIVAALSAGIWFDFFLTEPFQRFAIDDRNDVEATVLLVVISIGVTEVALWGHRQQAQASRRSGYLDGVLNVARSMAEADTPRATVLGVVADQIVEVLGADEGRYVDGGIQDRRVAVLDLDGNVKRAGHVVDVERTGLPTDEYVALPVRRGTRTVGHFLVTATNHVAYPSIEQRRVAALLAGQVGGPDESL